MARGKGNAAQGLVQVYTGNGKGKTTAALGLALRAAGHGMRVLVIQFLKGDRACGEHLYVARHRPFDIVQLNTSSSLVQTADELRPLTEQTLSLAREAVAEGNYDVVVLDEILVAASKGLITTGQVLDLMRSKAERVELILTGRGASPEVIQQADLVTEMVAVKHPFARGVTARRGIEY